jgi:acid phosphatase (class A)
VAYKNFHNFIFMKKLFALLLVVFFLSTELFAKPYFEENIIPPILLDPPFNEGSKQLNEQIATIIKMQKNADKKEIAKAEKEHLITPDMVAQASNPALIRENFPKLYHLLDRVANTSREVTENAKDFWGRRRPYLVDKRIKTLIAASNSASYPSGHTSLSYTEAHVLSLLIPGLRDKFFESAEKIAEHRVLVGMHFPQDLAGGRQLALVTIGALLENSDFQKDFKTAQKELEPFSKAFSHFTTVR